MNHFVTRPGKSQASVLSFAVEMPQYILSKRLNVDLTDHRSDNRNTEKTSVIMQWRALTI